MVSEFLFHFDFPAGDSTFRNYKAELIPVNAVNLRSLSVATDVTWKFIIAIGKEKAVNPNM